MDQLLTLMHRGSFHAILGFHRLHNLLLSTVLKGCLLSTLDSLLLCLYLILYFMNLQDGIFHKKKGEKS